MRRRVVAAAIATAVGSALLTGCGGDDQPEQALVTNPGLDGVATSPGPDDADATSPPPAATSTPRAPSTSVKVDAVVQVDASAQVAAFVDFVRARAESMNLGYATRQLERLTTPAEHDRQVKVINWAASQGYAVPDRPRVAVVGSRTNATGNATLDVCLWLPSTEFVSRVSGLPVGEGVPAAWRPASATLTRQNDGWQVARLADAHRQHPINCGGLT